MFGTEYVSVSAETKTEAINLIGQIIAQKYSLSIGQNHVQLDNCAYITHTISTTGYSGVVLWFKNSYFNEDYMYRIPVKECGEGYVAEFDIQKGTNWLICGGKAIYCGTGETDFQYGNIVNSATGLEIQAIGKYEIQEEACHGKNVFLKCFDSGGNLFEKAWRFMTMFPSVNGFVLFLGGKYWFHVSEGVWLELD